MPHQPHWRRVLAPALLLAPAGSLAAVLVNPPLVNRSLMHAPPDGWHLVSWWLLAPAFVLAEVVALRVRPDLRTLPSVLVAVPLAIGLLLAAPVAVLVARVLAASVVAVVWRRRPALRLGLDAARVAAATAAAQAVFVMLVQVADPNARHERGLAALLAGSAAGMVAIALMVPVSGWSEGRSSGRLTGRTLLGSFSGAALAGGIGIALGGAVPFIPFSGQSPLLAGALVAALVVQRAGQSLGDRKRSLERLQELSDALATAPASSDVVGLLLAQSLELVDARYAEATLGTAEVDAGEPGDGGGRWVLRAGESPVGPGPVIHPRVETLPAIKAPCRPPAPDQLVVTRDTPAGRAFLDARGLAEAMLVALRCEGQTIGHLLVGDRSAAGLPPTDAEGRVLQIVANQASVALRTGRLIHRLNVEARQDELTGLPNRLQLRELLDTAARRSAAGGPQCAVMVLDLDGFKTVNDTLGHQAGDELLQVLAVRLAEAAAGRATVARLGGDEFSVLSTTCADPTSARELAGRLLAVFAEPVLVSGARLRLGGSIGVALGPQHGRTGSDLLRHADIAMYAAKASGGGHRMFSPELVELTASGLTLATDLRDAIEHGEISVVAQPLVDLVTDELHSAEILARWQHPELGEVPPEQFFAAAERSGQVQGLSACVLDHALALSRRGLDGGLPLRVAVNLAARWLSEPTLPEQVGAALARHGVAADLLCLELTERGVIADPRRANETLARLRAMGVHLSVDDFGTGYSSLTYLSRLPVDQMKIDKSFVAELDANERDRAIGRSMIDLGRNLGLEVVAEGVSTSAARQVLADLGCRLGQGYLIARPLDPGELLERLAVVRSPGGVALVPSPRAQLREARR